MLTNHSEIFTPLPLCGNKNDLINFIDKDYFVNEEQLFKLSRNMNIDPINNDSVSTRIQSEFSKFKQLNSYVCSKNRLYPDKQPNLNGQLELLIDKKIESITNALLEKFNLNKNF